jgi:putative transposase
MTFRLIDRERVHHAVSLLCSVLGVTRQGYWAWSKRPASARRLQDEQLKARILELWVASRETYGAPRLHAELRLGDGLQISKKRVARLMRELSIEGESRRRGRIRTTTPDRRAAPAPDLVKRDFRASRPDEIWVADITYIPTYEGWLFLAAVMDLFSRRIVGWSMRDDLTTPLVIDAISMAIARRRPEPGLVHHSDRGSQYTSIAMGRPLRDSGVMASMGSKAIPGTTPAPRAASRRSRTSS